MINTLMIPEENVRVITRIRTPTDENVLRLLKSAYTEEYLKYICLHTGEDVQTLRLSPNYLCTCPACISKYSMEMKIETFGSLSKPTKHDKYFKYSRVFGWDGTQRDVFNEVSSYVEAAVEGYNSSVVTYGPAKSGKTYTLFGNAETEGIVHMSLQYLYELVEKKRQADPNAVYEIEISCVELNNNHFRNLLKDDNETPAGLGSNSQIIMSTDDYDEIRGVIKSLNRVDPNSPLHNSQKIEVKESNVLGIYMSGPNLRQSAKTYEEALALLKKAEMARAAKSVGIDSISFRGHCILNIHVDCKSTDKVINEVLVDEQWTQTTNFETALKLGKLQFIDLSSTGKVGETQYSGEQLADALYVNKSLSALIDVFHSLSVNAANSKRKSARNLLDGGGDFNSTTPGTPTSPSNLTTSRGGTTQGTVATTAGDMHVPYLNSKLTHVLKDALGGNCKTAIILTLAPEADNYHPNVINLQHLSKAIKIINHPKVNRIGIPEEFIPDELSDLSLIGQLRQYYVEPLLKTIKSARKSFKLGSPSGGNSKPLVYNLCLRSIVLQELPEIAFPLLPWMKVEVGSNVQKTPRILYSRGLASYNEVINFEVDQGNFESGIPLEIRVFVKKPQGNRFEVGRGRIILKESFPVLEEITELEMLLFRLTNSGKIFQQGKVIINGIFRLANSKSALFDLKMISPKKSFLFKNSSYDQASYSEMDNFTSPHSIGGYGPSGNDGDEPILLSIRKFSSHDAFIALVEKADSIGSYKFALEAKLGQETYRTPYIPGKGRYRGKEVIANILFQDPDLHFEVKKSHLKTDSLQILVYVQGFSNETVVIGRAIINLSSMIYLRDEEIVDVQTQMRDISNNLTGKVTISLSLSVEGMRTRIEAAENYAANLIANTMLPEDFENGWIRVSSVIAARLNTLKLLGNEVRYEHDYDKYNQYTKQDLLLIMEYKDKWASLSPVMPDQRDYCQWNNADFKVSVNRRDLLYQPIKFTVLNRKLDGEKSLIGTTSVYLHQFCVDKSLMMDNLHIPLQSKDGKPSGLLVVEGMMVKDNGSSWVCATIVKVRQGGRYYDVRYEDGQIEENVSKDLLKIDLEYEAREKEKEDRHKDHHKERRNSLRNLETASGNHSNPSGNYDQQSISHASSKFSLKPKFTLQEKIEVNYKSKGKWYPAKIWKIHTATDGSFTYDVDFLTGNNREFGVPEERLRKCNLLNSPVGAKSSKSLLLNTPTTPMNNGPAGLLASNSKSQAKIKPSPSNDQSITNESKQLMMKYSTASSRMKLKSPSSMALTPTANNATPINLSKDLKESKKRATSFFPAAKNSPGNNSSKDSSPKKLTAASKLSASTKRISMDSVKQEQFQRIDSVPIQELNTFTLDTIDATSVLTDNENDEDDDEDIDDFNQDLHQTSAAVAAALHHQQQQQMIHNTSSRTMNDHQRHSSSNQDMLNRSLQSDGSPGSPHGTQPQRAIVNNTKYGFVLGDRVEVNFRMIGRWYPGYIKRVRDNGIYDIDYDDGCVETRVDGEFIRYMTSTFEGESKYSPGDLVEANTGGLGYWYPAMIIKVHGGGKYDIQYDNGEQDNLVTERLLRNKRSDNTFIPKIKPFFSLGDHILVKTRSSTLDSSIKSYKESQKQAMMDLFELFKVMKRIEEEESYYHLMKKKIFSALYAVLVFKEDIKCLSGRKNFFEDFNAAINNNNNNNSSMSNLFNGTSLSSPFSRSRDHFQQLVNNNNNHNNNQGDNNNNPADDEDNTPSFDAMKLSQTMKSYEITLENLDRNIRQKELEIDIQKLELKKLLNEIAMIQKKNIQFRTIAVTSRAGVEEEEFHVLSVAQENMKEEIKALEKTKIQIMEIIESIENTRIDANMKLKTVMSQVKTVKQMIEYVLDQDLGDDNQSVSTTNYLEMLSRSTSNGNKEPNSNRPPRGKRVKKTASHDIAYHDVYEHNTATKDVNDVRHPPNSPLKVPASSSDKHSLLVDHPSPSHRQNTNNNNKSNQQQSSLADHYYDYSSYYPNKGDDVDLGYDNLYGSNDSFSTKGDNSTVVDVYMPVYDDRLRTGLGGLLLGDNNKKPFSEQNEEISFSSYREGSTTSSNKEHPRRRHSSTSEETFIPLLTEKFHSLDRKIKLAKHYYLKSTNQSHSSGNKFMTFNYDPKTGLLFSLATNLNTNAGANNNSNNAVQPSNGLTPINTSLPIATNSPNLPVNGSTLSPLQLNSSFLSQNPNLSHLNGSSGPGSNGSNNNTSGSDSPVPVTLTKEDLRLIERKKAAEEKKARASIAQTAYFKYAATLNNDREQCDLLNQEIEDFIKDNELHYILDNKFGITYEASKSRIQPMLAIVAQCDQTRLTTEETAFKYQKEALKAYEKALNARKLLPGMTANNNTPAANNNGAAVPAAPTAVDSPTATSSASSSFTYLSTEELIKLWDAVKQAYVMEWSTWEEARVMIEEEKAAYKNVIISINRSYRDLTQLTKIRNDVTSYLSMRQEYFEKVQMIKKLKEEFDAKFAQFEELKDEITAESNANEMVVKSVTNDPISSDGLDGNGGGGGANNNHNNGGNNNGSPAGHAAFPRGSISRNPSLALSPWLSDSPSANQRRGSKQPGPPRSGSPVVVKQQQPSHVFPSFRALNSNSRPGSFRLNA